MYDGIKEARQFEIITIKIGNISIDKNIVRYIKKDVEVNLTAKEYKLLLYLAENPNNIVNKERLCEVSMGRRLYWI